MNTTVIDQIEQLAQQLTNDEKMVVIARLSTQIVGEVAATPTPPPAPAEPLSEADYLSDAELDAMLTPTTEVRTMAEIIAAGHYGGWEDMGITDSVEWLLEQRRKREEQQKW